MHSDGGTDGEGDGEDSGLTITNSQSFRINDDNTTYLIIMRSCFDIFISYRRNGGSERAEMLKLMFEKNGYSSKKIFMDTHTLKASDVKPRLQEAVEASDNFILLITKGCFDEIKEEDLWIFEIKEAIKHHKNIIPIFFDGIESFEGIDLPLDLQLLSSKNGVEYNHKYSDACFNKICSFLVHEPKSNIWFFVVMITVLIVIIFLLFFKVFTDFNSSSQEKGGESFVRKVPKTANIGPNNDHWNTYSKDNNNTMIMNKRIIELAIAQELGVKYYYTDAKPIDLNDKDWKTESSEILSAAKDNGLKKYKDELYLQIRMALKQNDTTYLFPTGGEIYLIEITDIN